MHKPKKVWKKPEITLIAQGYVNAKVNPAIHEASFYNHVTLTTTMHKHRFGLSPLGQANHPGLSQLDLPAASNNASTMIS